jgi:indolepyruvate ferredoxin oxidoreductase beta subunit
MKKLDILMAGVGGQGIILCSDILGEAALTAGYDVKKTDTIGMAQRGGSVVSHIRIAEHVWSPLIPEGKADLLLAFEKLEAAWWAHYLKSGAIAIINNHAVPPLSVIMGSEKYPSDEDVTAILKRRTETIYFVDGTRRVRELGDVRVISTFMLGCASMFIPIKAGIWTNIISQRVPQKARELNLTAFENGRKEMRHRYE